MALNRNNYSTLKVGEPGKGYIIHPSLGSSFLSRLVYMGVGRGWCGEAEPGSSELSTYYPWGGAPQIWIDPSTLLVPVGHDAKGFGLCCFATAAVCSLSCLLPFIAPHPSMSLAVYVKSRHPFYSHLCKCYFIAKSR